MKRERWETRRRRRENAPLARKMAEALGAQLGGGFRLVDGDDNPVVSDGRRRLQIEVQHHTGKKGEQVTRAGVEGSLDVALFKGISSWERDRLRGETVTTSADWARGASVLAAAVRNKVLPLLDARLPDAVARAEEIRSQAKEASAVVKRLQELKLRVTGDDWKMEGAIGRAGVSRSGDGELRVNLDLENVAPAVAFEVAAFMVNLMRNGGAAAAVVLPGDFTCVLAPEEDVEPPRSRRKARVRAVERVFDVQED
jgi:hypothetical protein